MILKNVYATFFHRRFQRSHGNVFINDKTMFMPYVLENFIEVITLYLIMLKKYN